MINRRSEQTMMKLILDVAKREDRIRVVILNGSRANPNAKKDVFQDYDIVYVVEDIEPFVRDSQWIHQFGEILIKQTPDEMDGIWPKSKDQFAYLMLFTDWNRIDLTLLNKNKVPEFPTDSQSLLLLDKDGSIGQFDPPSDKDFLPQPPTEKQFKDCCNEFLWVSTYVAKGIWRKELTYAKHMSERVVKEQLIKLLTWYVGMKTDFQKTVGYCGKYLENYLESELWCNFRKTYVDANYDHMWDGLLHMCSIFDEVSLKISKHYGYVYNEQEYRRVVEYLQAVKRDTKR